jgi:hypothetical protein
VNQSITQILGTFNKITELEGTFQADTPLKMEMQYSESSHKEVSGAVSKKVSDEGTIELGNDQITQIKKMLNQSVEELSSV